MSVRSCLGLALAVGLVLGGCSDAASEDGAKAAIAVRSFFDAATAGDCAALKKVMLPGDKAKDVDQAQCDALFTDFNDRQVRLVALGQPTRDGRVKTAFMVMADVEFNGGPHKWLMRAELHDGNWKVRF